MISRRKNPFIGAIGYYSLTPSDVNGVIGEDVRLETVLRAGLHPVRVDPGQIDQVIPNLVVNARDAMPHGGTLTLETSEVELESMDGEVPPGSYILLTISDTGRGMTPEVQAHIFEPFFTTNGAGKGNAVDKAGRTVDFLLSRRRDMSAAKRFFYRATKQHGAPRVITLDGYAASHRAVATLKTSGILPRRVRVRSCKYLNNVIEKDHRRIKQRVRPMLGFKRFEMAAVTIRGIELAEKVKKQQFNLTPLTGKATTAPEIWTAVIAA